MKLIIDIPEEVYKYITKYQNVSSCENMLTNSIAHGTPLDDVKAEIEAKEMVETNTERQFYNMALTDTIQILDNIGKAESEK